MNLNKKLLEEAMLKPFREAEASGDYSYIKSLYEEAKKHRSTYLNNLQEKLMSLGYALEELRGNPEKLREAMKRVKEKYGTK